MALKDLKSDLSKFRKPIEKPLIEQKRVEVPKGPNQTPLSQFVDKTPSAPKSNLTTPKQGVTPNKFDNSSNFLGETTQNQFDNSPNYLGETTPTKMSLKERFLGQTEPNVVQQGDKFKGETETANITQGDRFKGETTPQGYSNAEKFKGETSPTEFKFVKQFLGETDTKNSNLSPKFLGETTTTDVIQGDKFKGETNTALITYDPKLEKQAKDPQYVDFFTNEDAWGFSPLQKHKSPSKFRGVDISQTNFDGTTSLYGLNTPTKYDEQSVVSKLDSKYDFTKAVNYNVELQLDNGLRRSYSDSVLKKEYNRFNLKEDSPNNWFIKHPLILTGIQTKKGEPFNYGIGGLSFVRGGAVTSTTRATFDALRIAEMILTPRGLIWGLKQIGMQRTNKYGKTWTPVNLLANVVSQHLGLKWDRPGVIPIGDETWKYNSNGYLLDVYNVFKLTPNLDVLPLRVDTKGGFDSFYGIGITTTSRYTNTFQNEGKDYGDSWAGKAVDIGGGWSEWRGYEQKYNPFQIIGFKSYGESLPKDDKDSLKFGVIPQTQENSPIPIDTKFETLGLNGNNGTDKTFGTDISDYEAISYGTIKKFADEPKNYRDFRAEKKNYWANSQDETDTTKIGYAGKGNYDVDNIASKYGFPETYKTQNERISANGLIGRRDNVGLLKPNDGDKPNYEKDLVVLGFRTNNTNRTQFRGTVSGITETFSPSWNGEKPNGRADKMYMLTEFERTLSFSFQAFAYSRHELVPMWESLKQLATFTMPYYGGSGGGYRGRVVEFTLGDLYKDFSALITSLTYTISDEVSWELDTNYVIPKLIDISVGLTLVGSAVHSENSTPTLYSYGV